MVLKHASGLLTLLQKSKFSSEAIHVADHLLERGMKGDTRCQICGMEGEAMNHVLFTCSIARQSWALCNFPTPVNGF